MTHEFIQLAEQIVNRKHFDLTTGQDVTFTTLAQAMDYLAWKNPALYQDYRRSINGPMKMVEESPKTFTETTHDFVTLAETEKRNAWQNDGERIDLSDAFDRAARKYPQAYESYRQSAMRTRLRAI